MLADPNEKSANRPKEPLAFLSFSPLTVDQLLSYYEKDLQEHSKRITVTPNLDGFRVASKNQEIRDFLNEADYSTIDGKPILWIAKWLRAKNLTNKISGSDLGIILLDFMNENGYSLFLFGGKEGVAQKAKAKIAEKWPNVRVVGTLCPKFEYENNANLCESYIDSINAAKADFVFLCTGFPKTELFYFRHKEKFGPSLYFSIGATIDFIAGTMKRAPKWMSKIGLEWLFRLFHDFKRLFKRYWLDGWFLIKCWFLCKLKKPLIKN